MTPGGRRRSVPSNPLRNPTPHSIGRHQTINSHIPLPNNQTDFIGGEGAYDVIKGSSNPSEDDVYKVPINNAPSFKITYSPGSNLKHNVPIAFSQVPATSTQSIPGASYVSMDRKPTEDYLPFHPVEQKQDYLPFSPKDSKPKEPGPEKKFVQLPYMKGRSNTLPASKSVPKPTLPDRSLQDAVWSEIPEVQPKPVNNSEGMLFTQTFLKALQ